MHESTHHAERTCVACREKRRDDELLPLGLMEGCVVVRPKEAARRAYVCVREECLAKLNGPMLSRAFGATVECKRDEFLTSLHAKAAAKLLATLGLARRSGVLEVGTDRVLRRDAPARLTIVASDLAPRTLQQAARIGAHVFSDQETLGHATGVPRAGALAIHHGRLADDARYWLRLWQAAPPTPLPPLEEIIMSKKRVHELAKEYGLENKDALRLLQQGGLSVKTHSSSVYEDEARQILDRVGQPKAPVEAPKVRRPGMMIVRKSQQPTETPVEEQGDEPHLQDELAAGAETEFVQDEAADLSDTTVGHEQLQAGDTPLEASDAPIDAPAADAVAAEDGTQAADTTQPTTQPEADSTQPVQRPGAARVLRMIDRDKLLERVPSRRLGGGAGQPGPRGPQKTFGAVTELRVVTDPFGGGREMVTVNRDKKGRVKTTERRDTKGAATPNRRGRQQRERAAFPSRLRKKKTTTKSAIGGAEAAAPTKAASKRVIKMKEKIALAELAHQLGVRATEVIRTLMDMGTMATMNTAIDFDTAQLVAHEFEYTVDSTAFDEGTCIEEAPSETDDASLTPRPPVVTIMGHVDHGKTSLLDAIRKTSVAAGEAGGITQHIGAYSVAVPGKGTVTFLDTPGHAAFTEMRARGANVTDIVVLVVAADDGVMPQTEEAIRHAQAAEVPIIVAVNKIDRPDANPDRVTQELMRFNLLPEALGGETLYVRTSATKKTGIDELLETILLQAEVLDLRANQDCNAVGVVVEAKLDKGRGPVATVLVQHGILKRGDDVIIGDYAGRVRAMLDHNGRNVEVARPSAAVEIIGLEGVPNAGDRFNKVDSADQAREVAQHRADLRKAQDLVGKPKMSLDDFMKQMSGEGAKQLNLVIKADVQGSVEAVRSALVGLATAEVEVKVLHGGVGAITESDIMLATASRGLVLGFNVRPDANARQIAQQEGVEIRLYTIIYEMIDDVKMAMAGLLQPESRERIVGHAQVRELFKIGKVGLIAGCRVTDGKAQRSARVRLIRDSVPVYEGRIGSLKHFKSDVREVEQGAECGIGIDGFNDVKQNDVIEFFEIDEIARTLGSPHAQA